MIERELGAHQSELAGPELHPIRPVNYPTGVAVASTAAAPFLLLLLLLLLPISPPPEPPGVGEEL
jgi:hypothetical protein